MSKGAVLVCVSFVVINLSQLYQEGIYLVYHSSSLREPWQEMKRDTWRQELKQKPQRSSVYRLTHFDLFRLFSCTLPRDGNNHSGLSPILPIINEQNVPQTGPIPSLTMHPMIVCKQTAKLEYSYGKSECDYNYKRLTLSVVGSFLNVKTF